MTSVFVSHSQYDTPYLDFLNRAFATTNIVAKYEEIEAIESQRTGAGTKSDIENARAIFVLLTENVENMRHTRDWIAWECGVGSGKQVWVFEPPEASSVVSVVIPRIDHYVAFQQTDAWLAYLRGLLKEMKASGFRDASTAIGAGSLAGAGYVALPILAPVLVPLAAAAAVIGWKKREMLGNMIKARMERMAETERARSIRSYFFICGKCRTSYNVHREAACTIRCPICNERHQFTG
jgi:hypothetical protein